MKLSIITINLNHATGLKHTVESVIGQTFGDYELIVIDGGSTDGSLEVITAHGDKIAHWVSEPDKGIYNAMNKGLRQARGEYVYFLNSGDWLASSGVLDLVFTKNACPEDLLYGNTIRTNGADGVREWPQPDVLNVSCFFGFGICHQTIFYKRELFDTLGPYDENLKIVADWDFNIRVLLAGKSTRHLPFPVAYYEGSGLSTHHPEITSREKEMILKRNLPEAVYRDYLRLKFLESECCRLKPFENWTEQIRDRNVLMNYAMVTYWFWCKFKRNFGNSKRSQT